MSQPAKKRRRTDPNEEMKTMMKEMVTEMVPLIVDMVSSRLNQLQSTSQSQTASNSELEQNVHVQHQQTNAVNVTNDPNALVSNDEISTAHCSRIDSGNNINITGPLHSGRPLGQGIDPKIKAKIWAEEYVQLGSLLYKQTHSRLEAVQDSDNNISFLQREQKFDIKSFQQWVNAFHIFVSIYCQKYPHQSSNLMKYMAIINKLCTDVGEKAALYSIL